MICPLATAGCGTYGRQGSRIGRPSLDPNRSALDVSSTWIALRRETRHTGQAAQQTLPEAIRRVGHPVANCWKIRRTIAGDAGVSAGPDFCGPRFAQPPSHVAQGLDEAVHLRVAVQGRRCDAKPLGASRQETDRRFGRRSRPNVVRSKSLAFPYRLVSRSALLMSGSSSAAS